VRRLGTFDGRSRFTTWAHRVATNACLDELRRRRRRDAEHLPDDDPHDPRPTPDTGPDVEGSVGDRLAVDAALGALPEEFRAPVVLRDVAGHDYAEIAEILGIPAGTVRSRIARGRARLADLLGADDALPPPGAASGNRSDPTERPTLQP
jgi:RNA polymerase sigma-70 factor (ECF subfamily)